MPQHLAALGLLEAGGLVGLTFMVRHGFDAAARTSAAAGPPWPQYLALGAVLLLRPQWLV